MAELAPGVYDLLLTRSLRRALDELPSAMAANISQLSSLEAIDYLADEVAERARALLRAQLGDSASSEKMLQQANLLLASLEADPVEQRVLTRVFPSVEKDHRAPILPLSYSALITNDQQLNYHCILRDELQSADRVDLICPFIGTGGVNLLFDLLRQFGKKLRVITTTYLGGTHLRALERLAETGAQVKIVYESASQKTALHAKAWVFHRDTGFSTATIGSSNLSPKALADGLEWNVRVGARDAPQVLIGLVATFERLWSDPRYEEFDPRRDVDRVRRELALQSRSDDDTVRFFGDLNPLPHQVEALEALDYARLDGRHKNLIVAATGTGKTLLAAFDYERLARQWGGLPSLLFVAHRDEILQQSIGAFQAVLRDADFGELHVGRSQAAAWTHVFASVQSLSHRDLGEFDPKRFDVLVLDEFHHSEAPTYRSLLNHFQPRELLGLTATPERADGRREELDKLWPPTFELRLWHALERQLLCPFHYFGIDDKTDLSEIEWKRGQYEEADLERAFVEHGNDRAALVVRELQEKLDPEGMRVVAFCVSIRHADFMAEVFRGVGFKAEALHSGAGQHSQRSLMRQFRRGDLQILCAVDKLNEGIDVPEINGVLFLRPTESATVFIQQLGRGLRNLRDKSALTVLDFVGRQNKKFRMDLRFRALTGLSRVELERGIRDGFPRMPAGCAIRLDRVTTDRVLKNLKEALPTNGQALIDELRRLSVDGEVPSLCAFLKETGLEPADLYRNQRSYLQIRRAAGFATTDLPLNQHRVGSLKHADDRKRVREYQRVVRESQFDATYGRMLAYPTTETMSPESMSPQLREELRGLLEYLEEKAVPLPQVAEDLPFALHARYTRDEIVAPFRENPRSMRQGTFRVEDFDLDVHLITLKKTERDFSPTTRYNDWFEAPDILHWESQSGTTQRSRTGKRLIHNQGRHLVFVREEKGDPFLCIGFVREVLGFHSERPISLKWRLEHLVPDHLYVRLRSAAG